MVRGLKKVVAKTAVVMKDGSKSNSVDNTTAKTAVGMAACNIPAWRAVHPSQKNG
jgi:hypothetical protein